MSSTNVQELYEQFMGDPEYIGREELALAEAEQRVIQSMHNHQALSMAKAMSPMEELLEFLIKKSVQDNVPAHFQRNRQNALTHLIVPEGDTEDSHQDLLDALWSELLPLAPEGSTLEDILADPSLLSQGITAQGHQMFSHTERGEFVGAEEGISEPTTFEDALDEELAQGDLSEDDPEDVDQAPGEEVDEAGEEVTRGRQEGEGVNVSRAAGAGLPTQADYGTRLSMQDEEDIVPKGLKGLEALNELGRRAESPGMRANLDKIREFILDFNKNEALYAHQPVVTGRNPLSSPGETTTRPTPGLSSGRTGMTQIRFNQALEQGLFEKPSASKASVDTFNSTLAHVVDLVNETPEKGGYKGLDKTHRWPKTNGGFIRGYNVFAGEPDEDGSYNLPEGFTTADLEKELKSAGLTIADLHDEHGNINSNAGLSDEGVKARKLQQQILQHLQILTGSSQFTNMYDALAALIDIGENPTQFARKDISGKRSIEAVENARGYPSYVSTEPSHTLQDPESGELFDRPTEEESQAQDFASYQNSRTSALEDLQEAIASLSEASSEFRHPSGNPERVTHPISPKQNYLLNNVVGEGGSLQSIEDRSQRLIDAVATAYDETPEQYMTYQGLNDLINDTAAELGFTLPEASHLNQIERAWIGEKNPDGSRRNAPRKEVPTLEHDDLSEMSPRDLQRMSENDEITLEKYVDTINQITKKYPYKVKSDIIRQSMFSGAQGTPETDPGLGSDESDDESFGSEELEEGADYKTAVKEGKITAGGGLGGMFRVNANGFWDINDPEFLPSPSTMNIATRAGEPTSFIQEKRHPQTVRSSSLRGRITADVIGGTDSGVGAEGHWDPPPSMTRADRVLEAMRPSDVNLSRDPITNDEVMPDVKRRPTDLQRDILGGGFPIHYANEHQQDWERWKPLMELHMKAGVPLEDFVSINPDTGQKIWSPESMTYGHQKHGFANWGEDHKPRSVPAKGREGTTSGMYEQMWSNRATEGIAPFLPGMSMGTNNPNIHIEDGDSLQSNLSHSASKRRQAWIQGRTPWQVEKANKAGGLNSIFKQMRNHWNRSLHQESSRRVENKIGAESLNGANDPLEDPFNRTRQTHSTEDTKNLGIYDTAKGRRDIPTPSQMKRHGDPNGLTDSKYYEALLDTMADYQDATAKADPDNMSTFDDTDKTLTGELQSKGYLPHPEGDNSPHSKSLSLDSISDDFPIDEEYTPDRTRTGVSSVDPSKGSIQRAIKAIERAIGLATVNNFQSGKPGSFQRGGWKDTPITRRHFPGQTRSQLEEQAAMDTSGEYYTPTKDDIETIQELSGYDETHRGGPDGQGINTLRKAGVDNHLGSPFDLKDEVPESKGDYPEAVRANYVNHSGGAHGADQDWDFAGTSYGVTSNHYHMMEKKFAPKGHLHTHTLSRENQVAVDARLDKVNSEVLKRGGSKGYEGMSQFVKDNVRRNALGQVDNADGIFAISTIGKKGRGSREGIVDGGTGWAVHLAIQEGKQYKFDEASGRYIDKPVYVFDQEDNKWYEWDYGKNEWAEYKNEATDNTPTLTPHFAGIGTREINTNGNRAIRDVYRHTFGGDALEHPVDSSVRKFEEWLRGTDHHDVEPERRQAILDRIESGELNGQRLDYYTKEHTDAGRSSHADVLAKLINETKTTRDQGVQGFLKALEPHKAVFDAFNALSKRDKQYIFDHFFPQKEGLGQVGGTIYSQHGQPFRIESVNRDTSGYYKGTMTVQQMQVAPENYMIPGEMVPTDARPRVLQFKEGKEGERDHWIDTNTRWDLALDKPTGDDKFTFYSSDPTKTSSLLSWTHGGGMTGSGFTAAHAAYEEAGGAASAPGQSDISPREHILAKLGYYPDARMAFKENIRRLVDTRLGSSGDEVDRVDLMQALESVAKSLGLAGIELPRAHEMSSLGSTPYEQTLGELRKLQKFYPERMTDEDKEYLRLLEEQAAADEEEEDGEGGIAGRPVQPSTPGPGSPGRDVVSLADVPLDKLGSAVGSSATGLSTEPDQGAAIALLKRELPATKVDNREEINHYNALNNGWGGTTDNAHEIAHFAHHAVNPSLYPANGSHPLANLELQNLTEETEEGIKPHPDLHNVLGLPSNALINLQHIQDIAKAQAGEDKVPATEETRTYMRSIQDQYHSRPSRRNLIDPRYPSRLAHDWSRSPDAGGAGDGGSGETPPTAEGAGDDSPDYLKIYTRARLALALIDYSDMLESIGHMTGREVEDLFDESGNIKDDVDARNDLRRPQKLLESVKAAINQVAVVNGYNFDKTQASDIDWDENEENFILPDYGSTLDHHPKGISKEQIPMFIREYLDYSAGLTPILDDGSFPAITRPTMTGTWTRPRGEPLIPGSVAGYVSDVEGEGHPGSPDIIKTIGDSLEEHPAIYPSREAEAEGADEDDNTTDGAVATIRAMHNKQKAEGLTPEELGKYNTLMGFLQDRLKDGKVTIIPDHEHSSFRLSDEDRHEIIDAFNQHNKIMTDLEPIGDEYLTIAPPAEEAPPEPADERGEPEDSYIQMADLDKVLSNHHENTQHRHVRFGPTSTFTLPTTGTKIKLSDMAYGPGGKRMMQLSVATGETIGVYFSKSGAPRAEGTDGKWMPLKGFSAEGKQGTKEDDPLLPHATWRIPHAITDAHTTFWEDVDSLLQTLESEGKLPTEEDFEAAGWGSEAHHDGEFVPSMEAHDNSRSVMSPMAANTFLGTTESLAANATINSASDEDKANPDTSAGRHLQVANERLERHQAGGYKSRTTPVEGEPEVEEPEVEEGGPGEGGPGDGDRGGPGPSDGDREEEDPVAAAMRRIGELHNEFQMDGGGDEESRKNWWENKPVERQQEYHADRKTIEDVNPGHPAYEDIAEMKENMEDLHNIASPPEVDREEEREEREEEPPSGDEQAEIDEYLKTEPLWGKVHNQTRVDGNYVYQNTFTKDVMPLFTSVDQATDTVEKFKQFNIVHKDVDFIEVTTPDTKEQDAEKLFEDRQNSLNDMATMLAHPVLRNRVGKNAAQLAEGDIANPELRAESGIKYLDDERLARHTRLYGDSFEGINTEDPDALLEAINGQAGLLSEGATTWLEKLKGEEHPFVVEEGTRSTPHWVNPSTNDEHSLKTTDSSSPQKQLYYSDEAKALHGQTLAKLLNDGFTPVVNADTDIPWPGTAQSQKGRPFWAKSLEKEIESLSDLVTIGNMYKRYPAGRQAATASNEGRGSLAQTWIFPTGLDFKDERDNEARTQVVKARLYVASQHLKQILLYMNKHWQSELHDPINYQIGRDGAFYYHTEEAADPEQRIGRPGSPITGAPLVFYPAGMPEHKPVQFKTGEEGNQYIRALMRGDKLTKIESIYDAIAHEFTSGLEVLSKFSTEYQGYQAMDTQAGNNAAVLEFLRDELGGLCYPSSFKQAFIESQRPDARNPNNKIAYAQALKKDLDTNHMNPTSEVNANHPMSPENQMMQNLSYHRIAVTPISSTPVPDYQQELFDRAELLRTATPHPDAVSDDALDWIGENELFTFKKDLKTPASNAVKVSRVEGGKFLTGAHVLERDGRGVGMTDVGELRNVDLWEKSNRERFSSDSSHVLYGDNWHKLVRDASTAKKRSLHHALETLSDPAAKKDPEFNEDTILGLLNTSDNGANTSRLNEIIKLSDKFKAKTIKQNKENDVKEKAFDRGKHWDTIKSLPTLLDVLHQRQAAEPNYKIAPEDATSYARYLISYVTNLYNHGMDLESTKKDRDGLSLADKVAKVNELVNEAVKFGADIHALDRELEEFGRGPDKDTPFGSQEHMEEATRRDRQTRAEKDHYDSLMDPKFPWVGEAWDDSNYEPEGVQGFDQDPSYDLSEEDKLALQEWETKKRTLQQDRAQKQDNANARMSNEEYERKKGEFEKRITDREGYVETAEREERYINSINPEDWRVGGHDRSWKDPNDPAGTRFMMHQNSGHYGPDEDMPTDHAGEKAAREQRAETHRQNLDETRQDLQDHIDVHGDRSNLDWHTELQDAETALNEHNRNEPVPNPDTLATQTWKPWEGKGYSNHTGFAGGLTRRAKHAWSSERAAEPGSQRDSLFKPPEVLGMPAEHQSEYSSLHTDTILQPNDPEVGARKDALRTKLEATGHAAALDHPHFGVHGDDRKQVNALTKQPPNHPTTGKPMSLIPDVGWADSGMLNKYQTSLGNRQGIYHPGGLIHDEDGTATDKKVYIDKHGFHGVEPVDPSGNYTHSNVGTLTPSHIRQRDLGHKMDHAIANGQGSLKNSPVEEGVQVHRFNNVDHPSQWASPPTKPSAGKLTPTAPATTPPPGQSQGRGVVTGLAAGVAQASREARTSKMPFLETMSSPWDFQGAAKTAKDVWSGTGTGVSGTQVGAQGIKGALRAFYPSASGEGRTRADVKSNPIEKSRPQSLELLDDYITKSKK